MSSIDEVSETLGALKSDMEHIKVTTQSILERCEEVTVKIAEHNIEIGANRKRIKKIEPEVASLVSMKNKAAGAISVAGVIGGVLGYFGTIITKALF